MAKKTDPILLDESYRRGGQRKLWTEVTRTHFFGIWGSSARVHPLQSMRHTRFSFAVETLTHRFLDDMTSIDLLLQLLEKVRT